MNAKKAKQLRRYVEAHELRQSVLLINKKTGVIVLGKGARKAYQEIKRAVVLQPNLRVRLQHLEADHV